MIRIHKIQKSDWFYLGQWVAPTLEIDLWVEWSNLLSTQKITKKRLNSDLINIDGRYYLWKNSYNDFVKESYQAAQQHDFRYFNHFIEITSKTIKNLLDLVNKLIKKKEFKYFKYNEILNYFKALQELRGPWMCFNPIADGFQGFLIEACRQYNIDYQYLAQSFRAPDKLSAIKQHEEIVNFVRLLEKKGLLKDLKSISVVQWQKLIYKKYHDLYKKITFHLKRFAWVGTHNFWGSPLSWSRILKEIKTESRKSVSQRRKRERIRLAPPIIKKYVKLAQALIYWRFRCAEASSYSIFYLKPILNILAKKIGLRFSDMIWFTHDEILKAYKRRIQLDKKIALKRQRGYGIIYLHRKKEVITGQKLHHLAKIFLEGKKIMTQELKGISVCRGLVRGYVHIVFNPADLKRFKRNEILIAPETTPDFVPAMKLAAAIVTDQGGLTSHAAIVSRELKIPCVIGTKIATKVLKDGDLVEVEATRGVVRKL